MQALFGGNEHENKRIGSRWGDGEGTGTAPGSANVKDLCIGSTLRSLSPQNTGGLGIENGPIIKAPTHTPIIT